MRNKAKKQLAEAPKHESMLNRTIPDMSRRGSSMSRNDFGVIEPEKPKRNWKKIFKRTFITLLIIGLLAGGWVGWKFVSNSAKVFGWDNLFGLFHSTKLKGEDEGRVNILLAGNSSDDAGHGGAELTDSIMIASINTKDNTGFLLSVPRDLYVNIPDNGYAKINETYQDGERDGFSDPDYAKGGMGLLQKVIDQNFGIKTEYYALVNYSALRDAVNAVGGITVNIQSENPRGLYDPSPDLTTHQPLVNLSNGQNKLNGQQALGLARARGSSINAYGFPRGDFDRAEHQRMVLIALKDKASSLGTLSNPVKVGQLFDSMGNNVKTDMQLAEVRRLYEIGKKVPSSSLISAALNDGKDHELLTSYRTRTGQSALVPTAGVDEYGEVQAYVRELLSK